MSRLAGKEGALPESCFTSSIGTRGTAETEKTWKSFEGIEFQVFAGCSRAEKSIEVSGIIAMLIWGC